MKKREKNNRQNIDRKAKENIEHRGNYGDIMTNYQMEMNIVHRVPKSFYSSEGGVKKSI